MITNSYELKKVFGATKAAVLLAAAKDLGFNGMLMVREGKDAPQKHWSIKILITVCSIMICSRTHMTDKEFYVYAKRKLEEML